MIITSDDTYEVSWYVLNGGVVREIAFGKVQPNKRGKKGYTRKYIITVEGVEPRFERYWKVHNPIGNIRTFAEIRQNLKRKIQKLERKRE
jgi:hypothetical protein